MLQKFIVKSKEYCIQVRIQKGLYHIVEGKDILESGVDLHNKCLLRVKSRLFLSLTLTQKGPQLFSTSFPLISAVLHICYLFAPVLSVLKDFTPCLHFYGSPMRDFWNIAVVFTFYIHQSYIKPHNDSKWQVLGHNCFNMMQTDVNWLDSLKRCYLTYEMSKNWKRWNTFLWSK